MAFLFGTRIRAHGTRKPALLASAGITTVLFHPDFNRRLRSCTESADPSSSSYVLQEEGARGLELRIEALTAGGEFHPALRTSAVRDERPEGIMAKRRPPGK